MRWFGKKKEEPPGQDGGRYEGKPLLILLENYVLDCVGHLPPDKVSMITSIVQRVYGGGEDWKATLRSTLRLDGSLDENLRQMWQRNQEIARRSKQALTPEDFARMIVDQNFSDLIE